MAVLSLKVLVGYRLRKRCGHLSVDFLFPKSLLPISVPRKQISQPRKRNSKQKSRQLAEGPQRTMSDGTGEIPAFGLGTKETTADGDPRKKATQACDMCRQRRTKCDGQVPKCFKCIQRSSDCTYSVVQRRRGPPKGYVFQKPEPVKQKSSSSPEAANKKPRETKKVPEENNLSQLRSLTMVPAPWTTLCSQHLSQFPPVQPVQPASQFPQNQFPGYQFMNPVPIMNPLSQHMVMAQTMQNMTQNIPNIPQNMPQMTPMNMQQNAHGYGLFQTGQSPNFQPHLQLQMQQLQIQQIQQMQMQQMQQMTMQTFPHPMSPPAMPSSYVPSSPNLHTLIKGPPKIPLPEPKNANAADENDVFAISALSAMSPGTPRAIEKSQKINGESTQSSMHFEEEAAPGVITTVIDMTPDTLTEAIANDLMLNPDLTRNVQLFLLSGQSLFSHLAGMPWPIPGLPRALHPTIPHSLPEPDDLPPLPDADTINQIIQLFFTHVNPRYGFLVEQRTFLARLTGMKDLQTDVDSQRLLNKPINPLLLSAILALGGTFLPVMQPRKTTKALFARAKKLLPLYLSSLKPESLDVESLMAILLLGVYSAYAFATALPGYQLGFLAILLTRRQQSFYAKHPELAARESWIEQEQRRRLWLLLFIFDHRSAVTTDHPPYTSAEQMQQMGVYLPMSDVVWTDPELNLNIVGPRVSLMPFSSLVECVRDRSMSPRQAFEALGECSSHTWRASCPILMGDVVCCHLNARKNGVDPFDGDNEYTKQLLDLVAQARRWRVCMPCATPSGIEDIFTTSVIQSSTDLDDLWNAINYHVICIQACIPRNYAGLNPQHLATHPTWGKHAMAKMAGAHAVATAKLLDKVLQVDPILEATDPFMQYIGISVGIQHFLRIKSLQYQLEQIEPNSRQPRPTQGMVVDMVSAAKDIETCIRFLHILGRKYRISAQMSIFLNQLLKMAAILPVWTPAGLIVVDDDGVRIDTWDQAVGEEGSMQELPDILDALGHGPPDEIPIDIPRRPPLLSKKFH